MSAFDLKAPADGFVSTLPDTRFDAVLVVSFGGPEGMDDVIPFLENVTRGRNVPRERLDEVAHHYELFDGVSPINGQNRALIAALRSELDEHGIGLPIYFGNRNWDPLLADTLREMAADGIERALAFLTSAYSSYSGCRQYREDIFNAQQAVGPAAPEVLRTRAFFNHPGWIDANADHVRSALASFGDGSGVHLAFTAHSIPTAMARVCRYEDQLRESARLVADAVGVSDTAVVYQSRSGPPHVPWLEPDILDHLEATAQRGVKKVVISPIGFVSDHLEVLYDLDVEARDRARELDLELVRASSASTHPSFVAMIRSLIEERLAAGTGRPAVGRYAAGHGRLPHRLLPAGHRTREPLGRSCDYAVSSRGRTLKARRQSSSPSPLIERRHSYRPPGSRGSGPELTASGNSSGVPGLMPAGRPTSNSTLSRNTIGDSSPSSPSGVGTITGCPSASINSRRSVWRRFARSQGTCTRIAIPNGAGSGPVSDHPPPITVSFPSETWT